MLKLAVIFESSPFDRKGLFNAVHNRVKHLVETGECEIDVFCIHSRDTALTRRLRHTPEVPFVDDVTIDGIRYNMLWYDFSLIDHALVYKFSRRPFFFGKYLSHSVAILEGYDHVIAHSFTGGLFAREAFRRFGVPYSVTWHGSDVHTHPWRNSLILRDTRAVMEDASCNFYVSSALLTESDKITVSARKKVLYNGVSDDFVRYPDDRRRALREKYGLSPEEKVVAFVGSIVAVKNVSVLQPLYHEIRSRYDGPLKFWMVGDGKLRGAVEPAMVSDETLDVRFWGNVPAEEMPSVMNCIDVMVLPSLNEGLPLVCAEAIRCGASVVGSDVGGVPEVIGRERVVPLGDGLVRGMASKVVDMLHSAPDQDVPAAMSWKSTAQKELSYLKSLRSGGS